MTRPQQDFTFINVTAGKKQNTRTIKRHVSNQTNRRKRQEAVRKYQESLQQPTQESTSASEASSSPDLKDNRSCSTTLTTTTPSSSHELPSPVEQEEEYREFATHRPLARRQPFQIKDYWQNYQQWALRNLTPPSSPEQENSIIPNKDRKLKKTWKVATSPARSGIYVSVSDQQFTIHIPRIDSPTDQFRMERASRLGIDFIRENYESKWRSEWQSRQWFQGTMLPLGIWRECFPLSVELIEAGKLQEAFFILNAAFNVTPTFFKENHPGLLIACLGAVMWTCRISDQRLGTLIRAHITQLSMAHLGPKHPISLLLAEQMRVAEAAQGRSDLLSLVVLDTFLDAFGPTHVVPLSMRWGYVRRQVSSGEFDAAHAALEKLEETWNPQTMPGAQIPKFLAFEKAKVRAAQQRAQTADKGQQGSKPDLTKLAEMSIELPVFIPGQGPALEPIDSAILKKLGKHLLLGSHWALALFIYSHISIVFAPTPEDRTPTLHPDPETLPLTVARILVDHLRSEHKSPSPPEQEEQTTSQLMYDREAKSGD